MTVDAWDQREVCPDGACLGVIGADGLCKVCGRTALNWGDERQRGRVAEEPVAEETAAASAEAAPGRADPEDDTADYEWTRRQVCPDGACIGVVGASGACKVCGKAA